MPPVGAAEQWRCVVFAICGLQVVSWNIINVPFTEACRFSIRHRNHSGVSGVSSLVSGEQVVRGWEWRHCPGDISGPC
eukprot:6040572-Lingulodinium_polyedra.AAC.1